VLKLSPEIYEVVSLAARYLFALLGVLIVLRSFRWLLASRLESREQLRRLPDAGMIGELVVLSGSAELPENTALPVPREGILGSVRSCDLVVPCGGVHRKHLYFAWKDSVGLLISPCSGCEAEADGNVLTCRTAPEAFPLKHGSFLRVGSALLRLRVFAGLDPAAGFDSPSAEASFSAPESPPVADSVAAPMQFMPPAVPEYCFPQDPVSPEAVFPMPEPETDPGMPEEPAPPQKENPWKEDWSD
jgi:hypothetical protein